MTGDFSDWPRRAVITDEAAGTWLVDLEAQRFLAPFLRRDCTVARAARELGVKANSLLYRVERLVSLGLLRVVREERRQGKAVKVYRASADEFFVPFAATGAAALEDLVRALSAPLGHVLVSNSVAVMRARDLDIGVRVFRDAAGETGRVRTHLAFPDGSRVDTRGDEWPPLMDTWHGGLRLSRAQGKAFQRELEDLLEKYARISVDEPGELRLLAHLALTPLVTPPPLHDSSREAS
ncbi:helix-turn-helix transcriptional regulator [Deinococcus apachensis]|uniref:helix-turn-helix transcriptional regulator n=1 Tax=Deinococcus apachensis TaxID=309886 RepID=UPI00037ADE53|nr:helix-turn-helix transcriptional regulator [Deinococcus apachensis]